MFGINKLRTEIKDLKREVKAIETENFRRYCENNKEIHELKSNAERTIYFNTLLEQAYNSINKQDRNIAAIMKHLGAVGFESSSVLIIKEK